MILYILYTLVLLTTILNLVVAYSIIKDLKKIDQATKELNYEHPAPRI